MAKEDEVYVEVAGSARKINKELGTLASTAKSASDNVKNLDSQMSKLKSSFSGIKEKTGEINFDINTEEFNAKLAEMQSKIAHFTENFSKIKMDMPQMNASQMSAGSALGVKKDLPKIEPKSDFGKLKKEVQELSKSLNKPVEDITNMDIAFNRLKDKISNAKLAITEFSKGVKSSVNNFKKIISFISSIVTGLAKAGMFVGKLGSKLAIFPFTLSKAKNTATKLNDTFRIGLKRVFQYASALFGIRTMYTVLRNSALAWLGSANAEAQQLNANLEYMKFAMGNALAPVIKYITNLIYTMMKALQRVIYYFTGFNIFSSATASNMASAAGSAKEMAKQLQGFDELNNLTFDSGGGGGGGATMPDMDLSEIESFWDKFDGDWYQLGVNIGEGISEALASIPWDKIQAQAAAIGLHLAELLNGMLDTGMLYMLGYTLAEAFNTALYFLEAFINEFNFDRLGQQLAIGLLGITNNIEWDKLARVLSGGINGVFETMYNFFVSYPWAELGQKIGKLIYDTFDKIDAVMIGQALATKFNAIIDLASGIFTPENFTKIGEKFGKTMQTTLSNIKWAEFGQALNNFLTGLLTAISTALDEIDTEDLAKNIDDFFGTLEPAKIMGKLAEVFEKAISMALTTASQSESLKTFAKGALILIGTFLLLGLGVGMVTGFLGLPALIIGGLISLLALFTGFFGIHSPSTVMAEVGMYVMLGFINGIQEMWDKLKELVQKILTNVLEKWSELKDKVSEKTIQLKDKITETWDKIKTTVKDKTTQIKDKTVEIWENLKTTVTNKVEGLKTSIADKFNSIKNTIKEKIEGARDIVKDAIEKIKGFFKFEWSLPNLKIPHFNIEWAGDGIIAEGFKKLGLPGLPKLKVDFYADGGFPNVGDLFVANERGPEWVSTMGGQTAVANQDQITQGIQQAAYEGMYKAIKDSGMGNIVNKVYVGTKEINKVITKQQRSDTNMYGISR